MNYCSIDVFIGAADSFWKSICLFLGCYDGTRWNKFVICNFYPTCYSA